MTMSHPPDWLDRSMLIFSAPSPGPSGVTPNLVVTRDAMPAGLPVGATERMDGLLERQSNDMRQRLANFREVARRLAGAADAPSGELRVDWSSAQGMLTQLVSFVAAADGGLLIATGTAAHAEFDDAEPTFRSMMQSFRAG